MRRIDRRHTSAWLLAAIMLLCFARESVAQSDRPAPLRLTVNHARAVTLDAGAAVAMVANPDIADVVTERNDLLFVVARKPGATNLLVYDGGGKRLFDREIVVVPDDSATATITRVTDGTDVTDYVCNPRCTFSAHQAGGSGGPAPVAAVGLTPAGAAAQIAPGNALPLGAVPKPGG
jgi:hypothetical protein